MWSERLWISAWLAWQRTFRYGLSMTKRAVGLLGLSLAGVVACAAEGGLLSSFGFAVGPLEEAEPNDAFASATPLTSPAWVTAPLFPTGDVDVYSFDANAGDLVFAALGTSGANGTANGDSVLEVLGTDGSTVLEADDNDGSFNDTSSSIAGTPLAAAGTYFLRVRAVAGDEQLRPYDLFFQLRPGTVSAEAEPNNDRAAANPLTNGLVTGAITNDGDSDVFSFPLAAGDTVFVSLDADPERNGTTWNPRMALLLPNEPRLAVNDANTTSPNSEALFFTVEQAGTYYVGVDTDIGAALSATYRLSVTVFPAPTPPPNCAIYASSGTAVMGDLSVVTSIIDVPAHVIIGDVDVSVHVDHANLLDVDVTLTSPSGGTKVLFADVSGSGALDTVFDDAAALPIQSGAAVNGGRMRPRTATRMSWFNGEDAFGNWTLRAYDDASLDTGTLQGWTLRICERQTRATEGVIYATDFEQVDDAGWTHSGTNDEWERGTPSQPPFEGCYSGTNCWKTNLDNSYAASSSHVLVSPQIALPAAGSFELAWAMKLQVENASFDSLTVGVREVGGAERVVYRFMDPTTSTVTVGNGPPVQVPIYVGWALHTADISDFVGRTVELVFTLQGDPYQNLAGFNIDDVEVHRFLRCGDGHVSGSEECDDGNAVDGDGCSANCTTSSTGADGGPQDDGGPTDPPGGGDGGDGGGGTFIPPDRTNCSSVAGADAALGVMLLALLRVVTRKRIA